MSDFTVEQKLELVRQARSRNRRDQADLGRREEVLYGFQRTNRDRYHEGYGAGYNSGGRYRDDYDDGDDYGDANLYGDYAGRKGRSADGSLNGFRLRFLFSLGMFLLIVFLDLGHQTIAGVSAGEILDRIARDYAAEILSGM